MQNDNLGCKCNYSIKPNYDYFGSEFPNIIFNKPGFDFLGWICKKSKI
jgi:hypothetical protein